MSPAFAADDLRHGLLRDTEHCTQCLLRDCPSATTNIYDLLGSEFCRPLPFTSDSRAVHKHVRLILFVCGPTQMPRVHAA